MLSDLRGRVLAAAGLGRIAAAAPDVAIALGYDIAAALEGSMRSRYEDDRLAR